MAGYRIFTVWGKSGKENISKINSSGDKNPISNQWKDDISQKLFEIACIPKDRRTNQKRKIQQKLESAIDGIDKIAAEEQSQWIKEIIGFCIALQQFELAFKCAKKIRIIAPLSDEDISTVYAVMDDLCRFDPEIFHNEYFAEILQQIFNLRVNNPKIKIDKKNFEFFARTAAVMPELQNRITAYIGQQNCIKKQARLWRQYATYCQDEKIENICVQKIFNLIPKKIGEDTKSSLVKDYAYIHLVGVNTLIHTENINEALEKLRSFESIKNTSRGWSPEIVHESVKLILSLSQTNVSGDEIKQYWFTCDTCSIDSELPGSYGAAKKIIDPNCFRGKPGTPTINPFFENCLTAIETIQDIDLQIIELERFEIATQVEPYRRSEQTCGLLPATFAKIMDKVVHAKEATEIKKRNRRLLNLLRICEKMERRDSASKEPGYAAAHSDEIAYQLIGHDLKILYQNLIAHLNFEDLFPLPLLDLSPDAIDAIKKNRNETRREKPSLPARKITAAAKTKHRNPSVAGTVIRTVALAEVCLAIFSGRQKEGAALYLGIFAARRIFWIK